MQIFKSTFFKKMGKKKQGKLENILRQKNKNATY